ncbi:MAG: DUF3467 domain-containing protein [Pseudomonadota bacterium]
MDDGKPTDEKGVKAGKGVTGVRLRVDDAEATGHYVNFAMLNHNQTEFVVDLVFLMPGRPQGKVVSRAIMAPATAKRLAAAMAENIKRYEARFGPIETPPVPKVETELH